MEWRKSYRRRLYGILAIAGFVLVGIWLQAPGLRDSVRPLSAREARDCLGGCDDTYEEDPTYGPAEYEMDGETHSRSSFDAIDDPEKDGSISLDSGSGVWKNGLGDTESKDDLAEYLTSTNKFSFNLSGSLKESDGNWTDSYTMKIRVKAYDAGTWGVYFEGNGKISNVLTNGDHNESGSLLLGGYFKF